MFNNVYKNRRVLLTGHTEFVGSWLALWLEHLGAEVCGFSTQKQQKPNHAELLNLEQLAFCEEKERFSGLLEKFRPEMVFHLAEEPSLLPLLQECDFIKAVLVDEKSEMGPEISIPSSKQLLARCRTGSIMGGGDLSGDGVVSEMMQKASRGEMITVHDAGTPCPQNHVLDILAGYLTLGQHLLQGKSDYAGFWSLGVQHHWDETVGEMLHLASLIWNQVRFEVVSQSIRPNRIPFQQEKPVRQFVWKPIWGFETRIEKTVDWYKQYFELGEVISWEQLEQYVKTAQHLRVSWTCAESTRPALRRAG